MRGIVGFRAFGIAISIAAFTAACVGLASSAYAEPKGCGEWINGSTGKPVNSKPDNINHTTGGATTVTDTNGATYFQDANGQWINGATGQPVNSKPDNINHTTGGATTATDTNGETYFWRPRPCPPPTGNANGLPLVPPAPSDILPGGTLLPGKDAGGNDTPDKPGGDTKTTDGKTTTNTGNESGGTKTDVPGQSSTTSATSTTSTGTKTTTSGATDTSNTTGGRTLPQETKTDTTTGSTVTPSTAKATTSGTRRDQLLDEAKTQTSTGTSTSSGTSRETIRQQLLDDAKQQPAAASLSPKYDSGPTGTGKQERQRNNKSESTLRHTNSPSNPTKLRTTNENTRVSPGFGGGMSRAGNGVGGMRPMGPSRKEK